MKEGVLYRVSRNITLKKGNLNTFSGDFFSAEHKNVMICDFYGWIDEMAVSDDEWKNRIEWKIQYCHGAWVVGTGVGINLDFLCSWNSRFSVEAKIFIRAIWINSIKNFDSKSSTNPIRNLFLFPKNYSIYILRSSMQIL